MIIFDIFWCLFLVCKFIFFYKRFFKKYVNDFTNEQIIQTTEKYVEGFNGSYQYMRLLKYFIFKEKVGANGEIEGDSELISYIENTDDEDLRNEWTSTLN